MTRRKKLTGAYCDKSPLKSAFLLREDLELAVYSTEGRALIFHTASLAPKSTRTTQGVAVMTLKPKWRLDYAAPLGRDRHWSIRPDTGPDRSRGRGPAPARGPGEEQLTL